MNYFAAFAWKDIKNIRRDSLLILLLLMPWLIVLVLRFLLPPVSDWLSETFMFELEPYYTLIISFFIILQIPMLFGAVFGFVILDEKDDHILTAIQVTPVTLRGYVIYRFTAVFIFSLVYEMVILAATGMVEMSLLVSAVPAVVLGGFFAIFSMLFLISFSNNKVEGLALLKAMGVLLLGPLAAYFINSDLQLLIGVLPTYWPAKVFWLISEGRSAWGYFAAGLVYLILLIAIVYMRFERRIRE